VAEQVFFETVTTGAYDDF